MDQNLQLQGKYKSSPNWTSILIGNRLDLHKLITNNKPNSVELATKLISRNEQIQNILTEQKE